MDGNFLVVKKELDAAGIKPALDPKKIGATFYRRSECQQIPCNHSLKRGLSSESMRDIFCSPPLDVALVVCAFMHQRVKQRDHLI